MSFKYHIQSAADELKKLTPLANQFLTEYGPGMPPDLEVLHAQAIYAGVTEPAVNSLCEFANMVAKDPALTALYHGLLDLSRLRKHQEQTRGAMEALVLFGAMPAARHKYSALGVPEEIICDTFGDISRAVDRYANENDGAFGIQHYTAWLHYHFDALIFHIGRLQYILSSYERYARVFVDDVTGEVKVIARAGIAFRGDGLIDGQNDIDCPESRWISEYDEDTDAVRGNCLLVNGRAIRTPVMLKKTHWRQVLEEGQNRLEIHIPQGKPFTRKDCVDSLRNAWRFYRRFFPDQIFETFTCGSWLLDPCMQNILPPSSGIIQFQKLFHIYPVAGSEWSFLDRGFEVDPESVDDIKVFARKADRSTSLRRGMVGYWLAGSRLHPAAGVIHQYDVIRMG